MVDESLIDTELSAEMDALLDLVTVGSAARNSVKMKVRQPLAELKAQPGKDGDLVRRAAERFADQICEELNLKKVTLHDANGPPLMRVEVKLNMKTAGPKFGARLQDVQAALAAADAVTIARQVEEGKPVELPCVGGAVTLEPTDIVVQLRAPEGWAGAVDHGTQVMLDVRITESLKKEGLARELVRHVQEARKQAGLQMEDRIELYLFTTSAALQLAIDAHGKYIAAETLVTCWATQPLEGEVYRTTVKVDGEPLTLVLRKVPV
jgi:isoleucyl-tRNA synthetase